MQVEGGLIDYAHHRGNARQALLETVRFSEAIEATLKLIDIKETLVIVTSDHTHSLSFNGNSARGNSILGNKSTILFHSTRKKIYQINV